MINLILICTIHIIIDDINNYLQTRDVNFISEINSNLSEYLVHGNYFKSTIYYCRRR